MRNPYTGVRQMTADMFTAMPGRGLVVVCTVAGNVNLKFKDGSTITIPVAVGRTDWDDVALVGFLAASTTATATVYLKD